MSKVYSNLSLDQSNQITEKKTDEEDEDFESEETLDGNFSVDTKINLLSEVRKVFNIEKESGQGED